MALCDFMKCRWKKSLHPGRQRVGRWTPEEDKRLKVAVMLFGPKNWKKIAQFVPGRMQVQCRERWVNSLDPSLNLDEWTEAEDSKLKAAIAEHGYCWSKVAACVPPRTDSQCRRRWKVLLPHEVPMLQAARNIQKAALISNFVDRESERPALGPNDFVSLPQIESVQESETVNPSGKRKRKSRRRNEHTGESTISGGICLEEVPLLTDCNEFENLNGEDAIPRNKRAKRPRSKSKISTGPTPDHFSPWPDTNLAIANGDEVGISGGYKALKKKKAPGQQKRKSEGRLKSRKISTALGYDALCNGKRVREPCSNDNEGNDPENHNPSWTDPNLLIITNGEEVGKFRRDNVSKSKKASKLHPRKNRCREPLEDVPRSNKSSEVETFGGDDLHSEKNKNTDPLLHHSSSYPSSVLLMATDEAIGENGRNDAHQSFQPDSTGLGIRTADGDGSETFGGDITTPLRCSTPDILESGNSRAPCVSQQYRAKGSKRRDRTCSNWLLESQDGDEMTLASFLVQSHECRNSALAPKKVAKLCSKFGARRKSVDGSPKISLPVKCSISDPPDNENSSASEYYGNNEAKNPGTGDKICTNEISEAKNGDDMTLASFCNKVKKRRFKPCQKW
ncbi:unnamed protein product [Ilex paraguariensis]|uniref:Uncharacterized protein n=1 Tax=Ilex paraguariensis TaxID=185542 RepID=A0ABC8R5Z2_9AQUA